MNNSFSSLSPQDKEWLDTYLDGTIESGEFENMQDHMVRDPAFRKAARLYLSLDDALFNLGEDGSNISQSWQGMTPTHSKKIVSFSRLFPLTAAAGLAFLLGSGLMFWLGRSSPQEPLVVDSSEIDPPSANGFAVIKDLFNPIWSKNSDTHLSGDSLGAESFRLASGTAEIQFYSGALMTIEGPAEISLKSAWEAVCHEGAVRMKVPPAARGFKLHSPSTEIIDLGTEFGLVVKNGEGRVEVFDGEISLKHHDQQERLLIKGEALTLPQNGPITSLETGQINTPDTAKLRPHAAEQAMNGFRSWQNHRDSLARNPELIAYYTFDPDKNTNLIPSLSLPRNPDLDGTIILAEPVGGRWPDLKSAFEFRRPGSRIRVNLPGEFPALTFSCWVRIDSLDRRFNALFMGDGYENGEPHWQIREDGKLMLSVMVDQDRNLPYHPESRFHHVYFSPKIWDLSMSGQWMHLTSVFDPEAGEVSHFINGGEVSREEIQPEFEIRTFHIGNAEIGNWGQPLRKDPNFTIRNLNGRMDELAIFKSALSTERISRLYQQSRSTHR